MIKFRDSARPTARARLQQRTERVRIERAVRAVVVCCSARSRLGAVVPSARTFPLGKRRSNEKVGEYYRCCSTQTEGLQRADRDAGVTPEQWAF